MAGLQRALPASYYLDPAAFGLHPVGAWTLSHMASRAYTGGWFVPMEQPSLDIRRYVVERVGEPGAVAPGPIGDPEADV